MWPGRKGRADRRRRAGRDREARQLLVQVPGHDDRIPAAAGLSAVIGRLGLLALSEQRQQPLQLRCPCLQVGGELRGGPGRAAAQRMQELAVVVSGAAKLAAGALGEREGEPLLLLEPGMEPAQPGTPGGRDQGGVEAPVPVQDRCRVTARESCSTVTLLHARSRMRVSAPITSWLTQNRFARSTGSSANEPFVRRIAVCRPGSSRSSCAAMTANSDCACALVRPGFRRPSTVSH